MGLTHAQADLVFTRGGVYTVDSSRRWAEAIAVADGRITAVGTERDIRPLIGGRTEVIDLEGKMLLPAFRDSHIHAVAGGVQQTRCDLSRVGRSAADYIRAVREYAVSNPHESWILGSGWAMPAFPGGIPTREELDEAVLDRPAAMWSRDHHSLWVNSRALDLAGVSRDTLDPPDGRIERAIDGSPSGTLQEGAARLVENFAPPPSAEVLLRGLLTAQSYLHSLGIAGWLDALVGSGSRESTFDAYRTADENGKLTATVVGSLLWNRYRHEDQIPELVELRSRATGPRFRATTVKVFQDGVAENQTAGMLEPYLDELGRVTANRGLSLLDADALNRYLVLLDAEGFQVHIHALGDRAVRETLDAIEAAIKANGIRDNRHHLAHIQVVHPDDVPRFRRLSATANAQPLWACMERQMRELTIPFLGPERSRQQYPFGTLSRSGAMLAFGSDWPVSSPDPLAGIHVAVNRTPAGDFGEEDGTNPDPFLPEEAIDLPTAIAAYTIGSAYVSHLDHETGSIEAGKSADLIVIDRNLFDYPVTEIAEARVLRTYVEGSIVYDGM